VREQIITKKQLKGGELYILTAAGIAIVEGRV